MTTPTICKTEHPKCGRSVYGPWVSPCGTHPDAGYCLQCGVARWLKRFRQRTSAIAQLEAAEVKP